MKKRFCVTHMTYVLVALLLLQLGGAARAETLIGSNIDSRFMLAFTANSERIEAFLPSGWKAIGFPSGPLKGANLLLGLEDRHLGMTADGSPASPPKSRAAAFLALGKGDEGIRLYILRVLSSDPRYNLFPDGVPTEVTRLSTSKTVAGEIQRQREDWSFAPETGGNLEVSIEFGVGTGAWVSDYARPYSSSNPAISRIFRYDQLVDLTMSKSIGKPLDGAFSISTTISELKEIFDGSEELVGMLNIPVYIRKVYEP